MPGHSFFETVVVYVTLTVLENILYQAVFKTKDLHVLSSPSGMGGLKACATIPGTFILFYLLFFGFLRQGFSVALEAVLELSLVEQDGIEITEIHLPLPSECWY